MRRMQPANPGRIGGRARWLQAGRGLAWTLLAGAVLAWAVPASAQGPNGGTPFSTLYRRPSVSPYTMLGGGSFAGASNPLVYQQLVQPRLEQEQQVVTQIQQGRQLNSLQGSVSQIKRGTGERQVNEAIRPTGHASTYLNYSHYYPALR